jgi:uncharacterized membrane protein YesL
MFFLWVAAVRCVAGWRAGAYTGREVREPEPADYKMEPLLDEEPIAPRRELPAFLRPVVPIGRAVSDWWREIFVLTAVSLIWTVLAITVIGSAPATAALVVVARSAILHDQPGVGMFFSAMRDYFRRSWSVGLVLLLSILFVAVDVPFYLSFFGQGDLLGGVVTIFVFYALILWSQALSYAWVLLVVRPNLSLGLMLRNGLLISMRYPLQNILSSLFLLALFLAALFFPPVLLFIIPPIWALLSLHNLYSLVPQLAPDDVRDLSLFHR